MNKGDVKDFVMQRKTATRDDFARGTIKPERVDQRVEVEESTIQDDFSMNQPEGGGSGSSTNTSTSGGSGGGS